MLLYTILPSLAVARAYRSSSHNCTTVEDCLASSPFIPGTFSDWNVEQWTGAAIPMYQVSSFRLVAELEPSVPEVAPHVEALKSLRVAVIQAVTSFGKSASTELFEWHARCIGRPPVPFSSGTQLNSSLSLALAAFSPQEVLHQTTTLGISLFDAVQMTKRLGQDLQIIPRLRWPCFGYMGLVSLLDRHAHCKLWRFEHVLTHLSCKTPRHVATRLNCNLGLTHETMMGNMLSLQASKTRGEIRALEVGVSEARVAEVWLAQVPNLYYIGVDPYHGLQLSNPDFHGHQYDSLPGVQFHGGGAGQKTADEWYATAVKRLLPYSKRSLLIRKTSLEAAPLIGNGSLDLIWLDGLHDYDTVFAELHAYVPKVRKGGIVAGHDYGLRCGGVTRAVHEFLDLYPPAKGLLNVLPDATFFWRVP